MSTPKLYASILLSLVLLINSCSDSEGERKEVNVSDEFQSYDLLNETPTVRINELIDFVEITRLEETEESLLGDI